MTPAEVGRPWLAVVPLVVLVFTLLGHVCVLPLDAHAHRPSSAADDSDADHHDPGHAVHAASCEVIRSTASPSDVGPELVHRLGHSVVVAVTELARSTVLSPSVKSPPLFLLNASLLI